VKEKILRQCCVCHKIKDETGAYRDYLPICPHLRVSHGYCDDCLELLLNRVRARIKPEGH